MNIDLNELKIDDVFVKPLEYLEADHTKGLTASVRFSVCDLSGEVCYGDCILRIGHNARLKYAGNVGCVIYEQYRGHGYAAKACRALYKVAKRFDLGYVYITCSVDNIASKRTIENSLAVFADELDVPEWHDMNTMQGIKRVFRYRVEL